MSYLNGKDVFPPALLSIIQKYVQGCCVYIPRTDAPRRLPRTCSEYLLARNSEIYEKYLSKTSVRRLSEEYHLSPQAIYKIIARMRK